MKKSICFIFLISLFSGTVVYAQQLTARVRDKSGEAVPFATVYVNELKQGVVTNAQGVFEMAAPEGTYTLSVSSMGYKAVKLTLKTTPKIAAPGVSVNALQQIVLEEAAYEIAPLYVTVKKEDPAYTIMRKAIGMAPYYRNLVQSYTAEVYLKGNLNVTQIKGVAALALDKEQKKALKDFSGIQESVSEIKYTAPDKYVQTIKSEKTGATADLKKLGMDEDVQMGLANLNIYSNRPNMPLAPTAFQNYAFKYLGDSEVDGQWVSKIQVTPKRKASDLLTGYLFIVRDKWNVQALDLSMANQYVRASVQQNYRFVSEDILVPVAYTIKAIIDGFGIKADAHFAGSIKYTDVQRNSKLAANRAEAVEKTAPTQPTANTKKKKSATEQAQEILEKAELKTKDMRKLRKIQSEEIAALREEERKERGEKPSLEVVNNYKVEKDSARNQRDSLYWAAVRPVPLAETEQKIFIQSDSIKAAPYTPEGKKKAGWDMAMGLLAFGHNFKLDSLWTLSYSGLINSWESQFNVVDGLVYGQALKIRKETKNEGYFQLRGRASWAFSRKELMWNVLAEQRYWANRRGFWSLEIASETRDFAGNLGVGMVNEWSSLLFRINPARFYEAKGFDFNHRIDIANGLVWHLGLKWEDRNQLQNNSNYSFFYKDSRDYSPNIPEKSPYIMDNPGLIEDHRSASFRIGFSYTPKYYYRMYEGRKVMLSSKYPTFRADWTKGVPNVFGSNSDFDLLQAGISQDRNFGYYNNFSYYASAGWFVNAKQLYFADFHHIFSNQPGVSLSHDLFRFQLANNYELATPEWYVRASARYMTPYLALKYIPIFKSPLIRESLQVSYLLQPNKRHYVEMGYALNGLFLMMDVGVFVGFENAKYQNWGFRLSLPLENIVRGLRL